MLNNRPLTYISNDPNDLEPLTPAHFLNNKPTTFMLQHELKSNIILGKRDGYIVKVLSIEYGKDGKRSTFLLYNKDQNGTRERGTSRKMMLFLS